MDWLNVSHEFLFNSIIYYTGSTTNAAAPDSIVSPSQSPPSASSGFHVSRTSTPPTELSSVVISPVFAPIPTAESMRRRQQSDAASAEIGNRLLKGWAMLADECPSVGCYGIPLVRPPKAGGGKDPKKVGTSFVADGNLFFTMKPSSGMRGLWINLHQPVGRQRSYISFVGRDAEQHYSARNSTQNRSPTCAGWILSSQSKLLVYTWLTFNLAAESQSGFVQPTKTGICPGIVISFRLNDHPAHIPSHSGTQHHE